MERAAIGLSGKTRVVGVFGWPVAHSVSPAMHNAAFAALGLDWVYVPLPVRPELLAEGLRGLAALGFAGANLTVPHKEAAYRLADRVTDRARAVEAVNTVVCTRDGLLGDNTDGVGFAAPLARCGFRLAGSRAVVLGAGGSARSVCMMLAGGGAEVTIVNRTPARAEALAALVRSEVPGAIAAAVDARDCEAVEGALRSAALLVNTTVVGMWPDADAAPPADAALLPEGATVYDLIYNPLETSLLREARLRGLATINGVGMLAAQGAESFRIWTGAAAPLDVMERTIEAALTP